ncbi:MAG: hypothetical protein PHH98_01115 [Candidatus Gracilibacteria bacterium]|nr:hypothetical protein [Candidatus Gracilibacteria bacterium]
MAGTTNDDELLILSDDTDSGTDFVLDDQIIEENNTSIQGEDFISFDSDFSNLGNNDNDKTSELKIEESTDVFSLNFDSANSENLNDNSISNGVSQFDSNFSFGDSELKETQSVGNIVEMPLMEEKPQVEVLLEEKKVEPVLEEEVFSLGNLSSNNPIVSNDVGTMTDILDEAIAKFEKREEHIESDIKSREEHISLLKGQIASLESAVNTDNEEVVRLNTEKQSIVKNRKALEKMKETPIITK